VTSGTPRTRPVIDLSGPHRFGAVSAGQGEAILDVVDDVQREARVAQESPSTAGGETREATTTALGPGRMLANPRRVRRA
jgi:hypothetical protein